MCIHVCWWRWHHAPLSNKLLEIPFPTLATSVPSLTSSNPTLLGFPLGPQFFLSVLTREGQPMTAPAFKCVSQFPKQSALHRLPS